MAELKLVPSQGEIVAKEGSLVGSMMGSMWWIRMVTMVPRGTSRLK